MSDKNIHIIIQARTGSTRLPNKVLKKLNNKIVLKHVVDRLDKSKYCDKVIVCTTVKEKDNTISDFCISNNIDFHRGSELNVLERYYETALKYKSDIIVRCTSDCPLIDSYYVDLMIEKFLNNDLNFLGAKYFGNHKFPDGFNCEIFTFDVLKEANENANESELEHVSGYIQNKYKKIEFEYPISYDNFKNIDFSNLHLSLDTLDHYKLLKSIFDNVYSKKNDFTLIDVLNYLNSNPSILYKDTLN